MKRYISRNISILEVVRSQMAVRLGINNVPNLCQYIIIKNLAKYFFEPLRNHFKVPIKINSFYRSKKLNEAIGGSSRSDHMVNSNVAAIDIDDTFSRQSGIYNRDMFLYIAKNMNFQKLIWEYEDKLTPQGLRSPRWIHVSYSTDEEKNKERIILYTNGNGYSHLDISKI